MTTDFEEDLTQLLHERADNIAIKADEETVRLLFVDRSAPSTSHRHKWWVAAAAAALLLLVTVGIATQTSRSAEIAGGGIGSNGPINTNRTLEPNELIIWFDPEATPEELAATEDWLANNPEVVDYVYIDRDTTYAQFLLYWEDNPEVIDNVRPDDLPTSFVVTVAGKSSQVSGVEVFPGVRNVETADESFVGPGHFIGHLSFNDDTGFHLDLIEGIDADTLRTSAVLHVRGTAMPGQRGNMVVAGRRTTFGASFQQLDELVPGDLVVIEFGTSRTVYYEVIDQGDGVGHLIADSDQTDLLQQTETAILTLISEHPEYTNQQRIVVQARLIGEPTGTQPGLIELPDRLPPPN